MCMLLSREGYVNHLTGHHNNHRSTNYANMSYHPTNKTCVVCIIWTEEVYGGTHEICSTCRTNQPNQGYSVYHIYI